jgi:hypothetical protein
MDSHAEREQLARRRADAENIALNEQVAWTAALKVVKADGFKASTDAEGRTLAPRRLPFQTAGSIASNPAGARTRSQPTDTRMILTAATHSPSTPTTASSVDVASDLLIAFTVEDIAHARLGRASANDHS